MSKLLYNLIKSITFDNATTPSSSRASRSINRDPKAVKVRRVGYQLSNSAGGGSGDNFEEHDVDLETIATAIRSDSYLKQGTMKYEELIFKSGWSFQSNNEQALEYIKYRFDMMSIATGITTDQLFQNIARDIVWASNCFIVKARARNGVGLPQGISLTAVPPAKEPVAGYFVLPPQTMKIARDENGTVTRYEQEVPGGGDPIQFRPEDVIHIKVHTPSGAAFGDPWIAPVIEDVRLLRKIEENASLLLYKHIFPLLKYKVGLDKDGYEATDEELAEVQAMLDGMTEDSMFVMPERHDVEAVKVDAIDGNPYLLYFENRVFSGMGLSQVDFGRGDTANRNTADAMTGQKVDRIKGWHKALETAINKEIVEELLVEGGFDPLVNPDFRVTFSFNEIEQERLIAKQNHEIHKFNNNVQTWEETRQNMGMEPVADESRLHFNMFGKINQGAMNQASNQNQPQNQNGQRNGPKRTTEFQESLMQGITNESSNETDFQKHLKEQVQKAEDKLYSSYNQMKESIIQQIESRKERQEYPMKDVSEMFSFNQLELDRYSKIHTDFAREMFLFGLEQAQKDLGVSTKVNTSLAYETIQSAAEEQSKNLQKRIEKNIKKRLEEAESEDKLIAGVISVFEALRFKVREHAKSLFAQSYNYGYALLLMQAEEDKASVYYEGDCRTCKEKSKESIALKQLSSLDEVAIFYRIPPWHPNCECELRPFKGGEM